MPLPWLRIIDGVLGATDLVRWVKGKPPEAGLESSHAAGRLEARLAGVVVSALREAFDRDRQRLEFERRRVEEERERADRLIRLEWLRQAGDREIGRLRLVAGVAVVSWLGTLLLAARLTGGGSLARIFLGLGWALLLAALASSLTAQSRIARALGQVNDRSPIAEVTGSASGTAAPWLIVAGLALIAIGILVT
jgi:hypothetical protein